MSRIDDARSILIALGMPERQQADLCCYSLLAMLNVGPETVWSDATNEWIRIHDILQFTKKYYEVTYAENSRERYTPLELYELYKCFAGNEDELQMLADFANATTDEAQELLDRFRIKRKRAGR